jgi:hypothetical protein
MKHAKPHHGSERAKAERRAKRSAKGGSRHDHRPGAPRPGETIDPIVLRRPIDAFNGFDPTALWVEIAPLVLPLLKRVRHPFPTELAPIHLRVPPGVWAGSASTWAPRGRTSHAI